MQICVGTASNRNCSVFDFHLSAGECADRTLMTPRRRRCSFTRLELSRKIWIPQRSSHPILEIFSIIHLCQFQEMARGYGADSPHDRFIHGRLRTSSRIVSDMSRQSGMRCRTPIGLSWWIGVMWSDLARSNFVCILLPSKSQVVAGQENETGLAKRSATSAASKRSPPSWKREENHDL